MSFRNNQYKAAYVSGVDNLIKDFYVPTLKESVLYQRRTAYFNSRALAMAARGLSGLLNKGGKMQLLCSVQMDKSEEEALRDPVSYLERRAIDVAQMLEQPYDELEKKRLGLLAHLLANGKLEIKIGIRKGGIYHEKAGIFKDSEGNVVAFNGSGNETPGGWMNNTESFHAFTSWEDDRHIRPEIETFERLWNGNDPKTTVIPLPFAVVKNIVEFKDYYKEGLDEHIDPTDIEEDGKIEWEWTPELAYVFEAPRLWNHRDFAYAETAIRPFEHQDYIASTVLESWPPRNLLADEVGLGKTIEAGLIIKGFLAAGRIERLLILAPKNILKQWQEELLTKFGIEAWMLDGNYVYGTQLDPTKGPPQEKVDAANPFRTKQIMLVSSQLIRSEERLRQLLGLEYDLVILDEAHHARASGPPGKREANKLLQALEEVRYHTQGLILMTATPIQLSRIDLWDLLSILELPGKWQDQHSFDRFFNTLNSDSPDWVFLLDMIKSSIELTGFDENAEGERLREEFPGVDVYRIMHILKENQASSISELNPDGKKALKVLLYRLTPVRRMVFRHTRELLKRYRAEGKFSGKIADRNPSKLLVELQGDEDDRISEKGLYNNIDLYVREYYAQYNTVRKGLGFLMEIYRKRLTSSLYAIKCSLEKRHQRLKYALETGDYSSLFKDLSEDDLLDLPDTIIDEFGEEELERGIGSYSSLRKIIENEYNYLEGFINDLKSLPYDTKTEHLDERLSKIFGSGKRQVIIFSQFKDTVDYLLNYFLKKYGRRLGSYSGKGGEFWDGNTWVRCSKQVIQNKFSDPSDPLDILICTDAASEGLNLQTCDTMINYDIPWNPMRIEQRIGRIDRIGQESPIVDVHTIFYKDSVEEKAYNRCLERIDFFKSALGHLQPILQATEKAIREAALTKSKTEEVSILEHFEEELAESIPQVEENLRIEDLLNKYIPRLPLMTHRAPVTQKELENALEPILMTFGWSKENGKLSRGEEIITFDPAYLDKQGGQIEIIRPTSNVSRLVGNLPVLPMRMENKKIRVHRIEIMGLTGFVVEKDGRFHVANNLKELSLPQGKSYSTLEESRMGLKYVIQEQKRNYLETELLAWKNREYNWNIRVKMYLDVVAKWRWQTAIKVEGLFAFSREELIGTWKNYLDDPERKNLKQLVDFTSYLPEFNPVERIRGRPSKRSPRDSRKEKIFLEELTGIINRTSLIEGQLKEMSLSNKVIPTAI